MRTDFQRDIRSQVLWVGNRRFDAASLPQLVELHTRAAEGIEKDLYAFLISWFSEGDTMRVQTSGSTGTPKVMQVSKCSMMNSACRTCSFLELHAGDSLLLSMNLKYIGAQMMVVRALVGSLHLFLQEPSSHPLSALQDPVDFLSMVPMQLASSLQNAHEKALIDKARVLIVGGGAVDAQLEEALQTLPCKIYSTYGMTETLSHIAMRRLNGPERSEHYYPLEGVRLSLSSRDTLVIEVPDVCAGRLETNDRVCLYADGSFVVKGRVDNVINSGGVKIQIEEDERLLQGHFPFPYAITSVPDAFYGERVVLLAEGIAAQDCARWLQVLKEMMPRYHAPKEIFPVPGIPHTGNGKIDRKGCRLLAGQLTDTKKGG